MIQRNNRDSDILLIYLENDEENKILTAPHWQPLPSPGLEPALLSAMDEFIGKTHLSAGCSLE
jgi:hypothetical protein